MKEKVVLIQGAIDIEINYFLSQMQNKEDKNILGYEFYTGVINNIKVVISKTLVGTINSTIATTIGIINFKPDVVINQGIAGSHREHIHVGDIIIGEKCCNINAYKTLTKNKKEGSNPFQWEPNKRAKDIKYGDKKLTELLEKLFHDDAEKHIYKGTLGSGDIFNREYDRILWINNMFSTDSEDMESIGCYSVCEKFNIPCIGTRIISNNELILEELDREKAIELQRVIF